MSFSFELEGVTYQVRTHVGNGNTLVEVREKDEARDLDLEPEEEAA